MSRNFPKMESPELVIYAPMRTQMIKSTWECLSSVIDEGKYMNFMEPPTLEQSCSYLGRILDHCFPVYAALLPGLRVIGSCDICPSPHASLAHIGTLGLFVHKDYREMGVGRTLIELSLKKAQTLRLERVELEVFKSNTRAHNLYKSLGFVEEGIKTRGRKVDGVYDDIIMMVKFLK